MLFYKQAHFHATRIVYSGVQFSETECVPDV